MFKVFSKQLVEKVRELDSRKNQTEKAFHGFLPPALVRDMRREQVKHDENLTTRSLTNNLQFPMQPITQEFDCVTIFYGDIIGFDELVADCSPTEVTLLVIFILQLKL